MDQIDRNSEAEELIHSLGILHKLYYIINWHTFRFRGRRCPQKLRRYRVVLLLVRSLNSYSKGVVTILLLMQPFDIVIRTFNQMHCLRNLFRKSAKDKHSFISQVRYADNSSNA